MRRFNNMCHWFFRWHSCTFLCIKSCKHFNFSGSIYGILVSGVTENNAFLFYKHIVLFCRVHFNQQRIAKWWPTFELCRGLRRPATGQWLISSISLSIVNMLWEYIWYSRNVYVNWLPTLHIGHHRQSTILYMCNNTCLRLKICNWFLKSIRRVGLLEKGAHVHNSAGI